MTNLNIAVMPGDGIGVEVMASALHVLSVLESRFGFQLDKDHRDGGAELYRRTGVAFSDESFEAARKADAILFGAMGLPDVRYPDGTEIAPHLEMRREFHLYAGVRPVRRLPRRPPTPALPSPPGPPAPRAFPPPLHQTVPPPPCLCSHCFPQSGLR